MGLIANRLSALHTSSPAFSAPGKKRQETKQVVILHFHERSGLRHHQEQKMSYESLLPLLEKQPFRRAWKRNGLRLFLAYFMGMKIRLLLTTLQVTT